MAFPIILLALAGYAAACSGTDCCTCLNGGGGAGCASRCSSCNSACQSCVKGGGGAGCVKDGRCSCSAPRPSGGYSGQEAVAWADGNCGSGSTECAEFVSDAIKHGGESCFATWVPTLDSCLKGHGWSKGSSGGVGSIVIWYDGKGPYHTAISKGGDKIDQHNPNRCGTSGSWGTHYFLNPPGYTAPVTNETVLV